MTFAASLLVFIGGIGSLAWSVTAQAHDKPEPSYPHHQSYERESEPTPYDGRISASQQAPISQTPPSETSAPQQDQARAPEQEPFVGETGLAPSEPSRTQSPSVQDAGDASQKAKVVHHSAYQQFPVYRTVHHQASTPKEVTIGGFTRIEWTVCPVCGQKHDSAYNERIVDHVNETYCPSCGGMHVESYDEVIYY